jgi:aminopeptidase-like protein
MTAAVTTAATPSERELELGTAAHELMGRLFGLCRSLTGDGVRDTFEILGEHIPLRIIEVPSGAPACDWTIPDEWNVRDAYVARPDGERVIDFRRSNLHLVSYSEPVDTTMSLEELRPHLHTLPDRPDVVPYRTSYWKRTWGFCLAHRDLLALEPGDYRVVIDATLQSGHLSYAELTLEGEREDEILISTYVCHPSLANDNLSGIVVATMLAKQLATRPRLLHSYRFLFAPGTVGSLAWLERNRERLALIRHGLTVACIGDGGPLVYKRSRRGDADIDRAAAVALRDLGAVHRLRDFEPWGGDERQFCSPGVDLPFGALSRTAHAEYPGNHTSADSPDRIAPSDLGRSIRACLAVLYGLETNRTYVNLSPFGEPQLGRRGLYRTAGGAVRGPADERAMLWVLNQSDGTQTLLDIADRSGLPYASILGAAQRLQQAELLRESPAP